MAPKTKNIGIMFADVAGSTQLFEVLGDDKARAAIAETLELLTNVINGHNGTVIKTIGDEVMCTFPEADDSANAATEMQETLEDANDMREEGPEIKIRIGMHFGPALLEGGDVFGDAVNVAARMAAQAKGGQIITTKTTIDLLDAVTQASSRFVDHAPIKGKKDVIEIYEIIWQESDVTTMATDVGNSQGQQDEVSLEVSYQETSVTLSQDKSGLMMGRSKACDLPINEQLASRQHVKIELRRDKFFVIDQSTNGTHIKIDGGDESFLRREEMPINANGKISLGKSFKDNPSEIVTFTLKST
jgi:class 3 adenylate cyclase